MGQTFSNTEAIPKLRVQQANAEVIHCLGRSDGGCELPLMEAKTPLDGLEIELLVRF